MPSVAYDIDGIELKAGDRVWVQHTNAQWLVKSVPGYGTLKVEECNTKKRDTVKSNKCKKASW